MPRIAIFVFTVSAIFLAACQSNDTVETTSNTESSTEERVQADTVETPRSERRRESSPATEVVEAPRVDPSQELPELQGELESDGYGMVMIIDGSSPQAFADSLELIAAETSSEQFRSLDSAIRFLQVYSLGARNLEDFYRTIDGMTPEEIIERARNQRGSR